MRTLKDFVEEEIKKRDISISEFARQADVAKTTVNNILNDKGGYPHIATLVALAKYTGVPVSALFDLTVGEDVTRAQAYILAQRILELPLDKQELLYDLLSGVSLKQVNSGT